MALLQRTYFFCKHTILYFIDMQCLTRAAALAYATLFSAVPLMVTGLGIFSAFPAFQEYSDRIEKFLFTHGVAAAADTVREYIHTFAANAAGLSATSLLFLLITAVTLLFTVESALNAIWQVKERRHGVSAFLIYWAVLTLLPLLAGTALALSVYLFSSPYIKDIADAIGNFVFLLDLLAFVFEWIAFAALYVFLPNTKVPYRDAGVGALVATLLFEATKVAFGLYVAYFSTYESIYGALAAVPFLLVWIYLCWVVTLFGAVVAHVKETRRSGHRLELN